MISTTVSIVLPTFDHVPKHSDFRPTWASLKGLSHLLVNLAAIFGY